MNGKNFMKSAPARVRQTKNTKIRSTNFGIASRAGKALRYELLPVLPFPKDKLMQSKFSGAICNWLQLQSMQSLKPSDELPHIYNFDFNISYFFQVTI